MHKYRRTNVRAQFRIKKVCARPMYVCVGKDNFRSVLSVPRGIFSPDPPGPENDTCPPPSTGTTAYTHLFGATLLFAQKKGKTNPNAETPVYGLHRRPSAHGTKKSGEVDLAGSTPTLIGSTAAPPLLVAPPPTDWSIVVPPMAAPPAPPGAPPREEHCNIGLPRRRRCSPGLQHRRPLVAIGWQHHRKKCT